MTQPLAIAAIIIACLLGAETSFAGPSVPELPLEMRQLIYFRSIDAKGAEYARSLAGVFVYLHRNGVTFTQDPWQADRESRRVRILISKGLATDHAVRVSIAEWMKLSFSAITADFDSLKSAEAKVLSRDAFSSALLSSPQFWSALADISAIEKFDFRPTIRREIRALQFFGNGVAYVVAGGAIGVLFRALNLTRLAYVAATVPITAMSAMAIWDLVQEEEPGITVESLKTTAAGAPQNAETQIKILNEHRRRLVVLNRVSELRIAKQTMTMKEVRTQRPELASDVVELRPMLIKYKLKMASDKLPIAASQDDAVVRTDVMTALDELISAAGELNRL